jgi:hypothetical protein
MAAIIEKTQGGRTRCTRNAVYKGKEVTVVEQRNKGIGKSLRVVIWAPRRHSCAECSSKLNLDYIIHTLTGPYPIGTCS